MTEKCSKKDEEISHLRIQLKQITQQVLCFEQRIVFYSITYVFFYLYS